MTVTETDVFIRWGFVVSIDGRPARERTTAFSGAWSVHELIACHHLPPADQHRSAADICRRHNEWVGNPDAASWLTVEGDPAPWVCRRTTVNRDGTDPKLWAFFAADETAARVWLDAGQVELIEPADKEQGA